MDTNGIHIDSLLDKLKKLNDLRLLRSRGALTADGLRIFDLIPGLLHFNHSALPGYVGDNCPAGINNYAPDERASHLLQEWEQFNQTAVTEQKILGVYCMGSTASLGQCCDSDLDIWIIYDSTLNAPERMQLEQKCQRITDWASRLKVEANFFLVDPEQFVRSRQQTISKENCGSSQNWLLLDEFYRTCTRLAGCNLVWFLVPVACEDQYSEYVASLFEQHLVNHEEWVDLGGIARVPAEEYFGAALWQLYKGIDSPFKAVLKTLLLESYSQEYPNTRLLCHDFKDRWMTGSQDPLALDSYCLVLDRVTHYLRQSSDWARLDLARRCFYLKTCIALSAPSDHSNWQLVCLQRLVSRWDWQPEQLVELDRREHWKVEQVKTSYREVLEALMVGFRKLIEFARRNQISEAINPEDIGVLSRKLYASFEMTPSKIELINPNIAPSLYEPVVTFVEVPEGRKIAAGWYLYKHPLRASSMIGAKAQKHCDHLSKLIAWAYFNGIVNPGTEIHVHSPSSKVSVDTVRRIVRDLAATMPVTSPATRQEELIKPSEIRQLLLFVNMSSGHDDVQPVVNIDASQDVFSIGEPQVNLVRSIDLLYISSWNEIHSFHFEGNEAILDCMVMLTSKMHKQATIPIRSDVFCYSNLLDHVVGQQVRRVLLDCMTMRLDRSGVGASYRLLTLAGERYGLFFERRTVYKHKLENPVDFYRHISNNKVGGRDIFDRPAGHVDTPAIVENHASEGLVQFFFERCSEGFNIYVVDEENQVELYEHFKGAKDELVQSVNRFYSSSRQKETAEAQGQMVNFNLPQFYEIIERNGMKQILPYSSGAQQNVSQSVNL
ncbi:class I adenylate cyclase [Echinimonas agarilytica]|uniref:Adenylate cyclase n=1 Tax=Echinimonas agarilytica TaxID=1215918 RepID=A0AA41W3Y3_9GAMM|nr:class I adenylate cyclase [Echinimonas agarilytica]MCM2678254.1 class I adenylate cyclase [Echinimonas agarilytica]